MSLARDKILESAFLLMAQKGYDDVSVSDIQREADVARGLLYFYFKNKTDLFFAACKRYFFEGYLADVDFDKISLKDFIAHINKVSDRLLKEGKGKIGILQYNTLYSVAIMRDPRLHMHAREEFARAMRVIRNAKKRGEIRDLPENFVGATLLSIFGRTTYITKTPSDAHIRKRIKDDMDIFYSLIKK